MIENNYGPKNDPSKDPFDGEYIGNIWGWKFSFMGLALIVGLVVLMAYRHAQLEDAPPKNTTEQVDTKADSLDNEIIE